MKRAIFFDLDGTLWNAINELTESWNLAMKDNNLPYRFSLEQMTSYMGLTPLETVKLAFPDVPEAIGLSYFKICFNAEIEYLAKKPGKLYPHQKEVLEKLSKTYDLYVVSNADVGYIDNYINACNMKKYYKGILCAGDTGLDKSENIKYLMKKEGIDEVIYVGDTAKDMEQSLKAGVHFIFASYGFGKISNPLYKIDSLSELIDVISVIFK